MQFPQSQCCNNATYQDNCFTGCGQTMPIVPGTSPALQTWNGQFFVVADGSAQNRISLPFLQVNSGGATYVVGADNNGVLSYYNPAFGGSATNLIGGNTGYIPYQSATNITTFLPIGTTGQALQVSNLGLPVWASPTAQNIIGGAAGEVVYQTATDVTGFTAVGTTGQVLTSGGTGSPKWTSQSALSVGSATTATNIANGLAGSLPYQTAPNTTSFIYPSDLLIKSTGSTTPRTLANRFTDPISVLDFGADPTGGSDSTTSIQAAFNSGFSSIYFPSGIYNTGALNIPATVKQIFGDGGATIITASGVYANNVGIFTSSNNEQLKISSLSFNQNTTAYPSNFCIHIDNSIFCTIENVYINQAGYFGIYISNSSRINITNSVIGFYGTIGIYSSGSSYVNVNEVFIYGTGASHQIQLSSGQSCSVSNCFVTQSNPGGFCINMALMTFGIIQGNFCTTDNVEGINVTDCSSITITGNYVVCGNNQHDFGISVAQENSSGSGFIITNNTIWNSAKCGIALANIGSTGVVITDSIISGNAIFNVGNNGLYPNQSGIVVYSGNNAYIPYYIAISNNIITDFSGHMSYGVQEITYGGLIGNSNYIGRNYINGSSVTQDTLTVNPKTVVYDETYTTSTPTITSTGGALTSSSCTVNYKRQGDYLALTVKITITNNGTGSGALSVPMPYTNALGTLAGRAGAVSGKCVIGVAESGAMLIRNYDNSYPASTGETILMTGLVQLTL